MSKNGDASPEPVKCIQRDCTDEEMKYIDILLEILRSTDEKSKHALKVMMNQIHGQG
ncbi:MAG: hypothetical protein ACUZ8E_01920 [Candidatus Anammoxibacter sp.]